MLWSQVYDPFGNMIISALVAAIPVVVLLGAIGIIEMKAHWAALLGLVTALLVAVVVCGMPVSMAGMAALYGAAFGLMPIGWIILNVIFFEGAAGFGTPVAVTASMLLGLGFS